MRKRMIARNPVYVIMLAVCAVVGIFVYLTIHLVQNSNPRTASTPVIPSEQDGVLLATATTPNPLQEDGDDDGLQDWEEVLWNTDPANADTDGDGVSDGVEVSKGDDPTTPGSGRITEGDGFTPDQNTSRTDTESMARNLMTSVILDLSKSPNGAAGVDKDKIVNNLLETTQGFLTVTPLSTESLVIVASTEASRRTYLKDMNTMLTGMTTSNEPESDTMARLARSTDKTEPIATLMRTSQSYAVYIETFAQVSVPNDAVKLHIDLVNALRNYNNSLAGMVYIETDPVRAAASLSVYTARNQAVALAMYAYAQYLNSHNMVQSEISTTLNGASSNPPANQ
jgi:hypothetical protein